MANMRSETGEIINSQLSFITVELAKFNRQIDQIEITLDKLIYTMKTVHEVSEPTQFPQFWNEEWLQVAIQELDKRALTPEQRLNYEMTISANALTVKNEQKKIQDAERKVKEVAIRKLLVQGKLSIEDIAEANDVTVDFVADIQRNL